MLWGKTESKNVRLRNVWRTHTKVRSTQYAEYAICRALVASEKIFTLEINLNMLTAINYIQLKVRWSVSEAYSNPVKQLRWSYLQKQLTVFSRRLILQKAPSKTLGRVLSMPLSILFQPFKRQPQKMVKHSQTIRRQQLTNCLSVFDHLVRLTLKGLTLVDHQSLFWGMQILLGVRCLDFDFQS